MYRIPRESRFSRTSRKQSALKSLRSKKTVPDGAPQRGNEHIAQGKFHRNGALGWFVVRDAPLEGAKADLKKFLPCVFGFCPCRAHRAGGCLPRVSAHVVRLALGWGLLGFQPEWAL